MSAILPYILATKRRRHATSTFLCGFTRSFSKMDAFRVSLLTDERQKVTEIGTVQRIERTNLYLITLSAAGNSNCDQLGWTEAEDAESTRPITRLQFQFPRVTCCVWQFASVWSVIWKKTREWSVTSSRDLLNVACISASGASVSRR